MEYSSSETSGVENESKINENVKKNFTLGSPKFTRQPLQQLISPSVSTPQDQPSLIPYRYHRCKAIPEETENQENIDPCCGQQKNNDRLCGQKSQGTCSDALSDGGLSPFAYPHILESYQAASSPSSSYSSPIGSAKILHEVNCTNFESPKTSFSTPLRTNNPASSAYGSCSMLVKTKSESSSEKEKSKHRRISACGTFARGGPPSSQSSSSHANSSGLSHVFSVVTPSKSAFTPSPSSRSVFRTPSNTYSSSISDTRLLTPQQRSHGYRQVLNPFEVGVDCLQLPTVSPSLFQHVVSPSQETGGNFRWTIEQLAALQPANIDASPYSPAESFPDSDYEQQAQAAIDKFFSQQEVVPSPWSGSNKQINLLQVDCTLAKPVSCEPTPITRTVCCQTELSLPVVLPEPLEEMLKPYCTFTQDQWWQGTSDLEEGNSLNNTTLRRKLLFSHEELLNATPICSPRNTTASEGSTSSSSVGPLPFHDDDDGHNAVQDEDDDDDDEGSMWCNDVVRVVSSSAADPNLRRCPPPTPPAACEQERSHNTDVNIELSKASKMFNSPFISKSPPNLSPIEPQLQMSPVRHMTVSSPDISPVYKNSEKILVAEEMSEQLLDTKIKETKLINSPCVSPILLQQESSSALAFLETRSLVSSCNASQTNPVGDVVLGMNSGNNEANVACHNEVLILISQENEVFVSDSKIIPKQSTSSEGHLGTYIPVNNVHHENEVLASQMVCTLKQDKEEEENLHRKKTEEVKSFKQQHTDTESCEEMKSVPASPKAEKRSSGNLSHFSSSPIRDGMQMPLVIDTSCSKFSESPPLSPIFCRSMLAQNQPDQQKSCLQKIQECHFTTGNLDQSTLLSVDMEGRSGSEEEVMMEEGIPTAVVTNLGSTPPSNKHFIPGHEFSSVCDMDTDSQQSLEVNVSHEGKSLESGYQTGSLQSTNFNITGFTSNSTIGSMNSFQRDRQVILCGADAPSVQLNLGRNPEKMMRSQSGIACKDQM